MNEKNTMEQYLDYLNENILPFIDYDKLHNSYKTDMIYAKGILNLLHEAMVKVYGSDYLDWKDGDDGYVVIPGVLRGEKTGNICLALFDIDLQSSGEHCGTDYLCRLGVISQGGSSEQEQHLTTAVNNSYVPYEYCYTAIVHDDHHVDVEKLSKELKAVLNDFHKYKVDLVRSPDVPDESEKKPSILDNVHETEREIKEKNNDKHTNKKTEPEH